MTIEKLKADDIPALLALYGEFEGFALNLEKSIANYQAMERDDRYLLLAAKDGERVVGTVLGIICPTLAIEARPFLVVEDVIVAQTHRRTGIGKALMDALDVFAQENDCLYAILVSSGFRKGAHKFYESIGYTEDVRGFRKHYE
ncbi:MAG: GNAT family N-acetyltransferase [Oscillospiraceae bacterium]